LIGSENHLVCFEDHFEMHLMTIYLFNLFYTLISYHIVVLNAITGSLFHIHMGTSFASAANRVKTITKLCVTSQKNKTKTN